MPRLLAASLVLFVLAGPSLAGPTKAPGGTGHALLVALPGDKQADEKDLRALAAVLPRAGLLQKNVVLLGPEIGKTARDRAPTLAAIRRELKALATRAAAGDRVLLAVSGAGVQPKGDKDTYLVPSDGKAADVKTLLSVSELSKELAAGKAASKLALLDVCRPAAPCRPQDVAVPAGLAVLFACAAGETGQRMKSGEGAFFHAVTRAFNGEADTNKDRNLTLRELQAFVEDQVAKLVKGQSPELLGKVKGLLEVARLSPAAGGLSALLVDAIHRVSKGPVVPAKRPYVTVLLPGGAADRAGLKAGDLVLSIDGKDVPSPEAARSALTRAGAGASVELVVLRQGKKMTLKAVLDKELSREDELRLLLPLAEKGNLEACVAVGWCYDQGLGVKQDYAAALKWYRKAADKGHANARSNLGYLYLKGRGTPVDHKAAVAWYKKAVDQNLALAQWHYGKAHEEGTGVAKSDLLAVSWYRKAAEQGLAPGQAELARMHFNGRGVVRNYAEALKWNRRAADQGYSVAQWNLGTTYLMGSGVVRDLGEARKWLLLAADQKHPEATTLIGMLYVRGLGVTKDLARAAKWFRKGADLGEPFGQFELGVAYDEGKGVEKDHAEAARWLTLAANQGHAHAQFHLADMHLAGRGVKKDRAAGLVWLRKAAKGGHAAARKKLQDLGEKP